MDSGVEQYLLISFLLAGGLGYLLGSIPFGLLLTRIAGVPDIRQSGSGNIGATNVLRAAGRKIAALTLLCDGAKGAVAVLITAKLAPEAAVIAGAFAFLGHLYPVWLGFKGGKGVATFIGVLLAVAWPVGLATIGTWLVTMAMTRISSLSALVAAALSPAFAYFTAPAEVVLLTIALSVTIYLRHSDNIRRLAKGEEPRIGGNKK